MIQTHKKRKVLLSFDSESDADEYHIETGGDYKKKNGIL